MEISRTRYRSLFGFCFHGSLVVTKISKVQYEVRGSRVQDKVAFQRIYPCLYNDQVAGTNKGDGTGGRIIRQKGVRKRRGEKCFMVWYRAGIPCFLSSAAQGAG